MLQWYYRRLVIRNRGSLAQGVLLQKNGVVRFKGILKDINIPLVPYVPQTKVCPCTRRLLNNCSETQPDYTLTLGGGIQHRRLGRAVEGLQ